MCKSPDDSYRHRSNKRSADTEMSRGQSVVGQSRDKCGASHSFCDQYNAHDAHHSCGAEGRRGKRVFGNAKQAV
jgi:hypothetical protein